MPSYTAILMTSKTASLLFQNSRQQTITIHDTPSPAVSVITISDSDDDNPPKWFVFFFNLNQFHIIQ